MCRPVTIGHDRCAACGDQTRWHCVARPGTVRHDPALVGRKQHVAPADTIRHRWYRDAIPLAEERYKAYLADRAEEEEESTR